MAYYVFQLNCNYCCKVKINYIFPTLEHIIWKILYSELLQSVLQNVSVMCFVSEISSYLILL